MRQKLQKSNLGSRSTPVGEATDSPRDEAAARIFLEKYKQILRSVLPPEMVTEDGFLKKPDGQGESISITPPLKPRPRFSFFSSGAAFYRGGFAFKMIRRNLDAATGLRREERCAVIEIIAELEAGAKDTVDCIDLSRQNLFTALAHEIFHDIQGYLLDYYPAVYTMLQQGVLDRRQAIEAWYADAATKRWHSYTVQQLFPAGIEQIPSHYNFLGSLVEEVRKRKKEEGFMGWWRWGASRALVQLGSVACMDMSRAEAIPVLMAAAAGGEQGSQKILSEIFKDAGLNPDFYLTLPKFDE